MLNRFLLFGIFAVNLVLSGFAVYSLRSNRSDLIKSEVRLCLEERLSAVVRGIISEYAGVADKATETKGGDEGTRPITNITVSICPFGSDVCWIDGQRYELGDFIAPYGVILRIGRNYCIAQNQADGSLTVLSQGLHEPSKAQRSAGKSERRDA